MKQVPSTQFQKSYSGLQEPVEVTAHGHVIGTYFPGDPARYVGPTTDHGYWPQPLVPNPDPTSVVRSTTDQDFIRPVSGQAAAQRAAKGLMDLQRKALTPEKRK